jgi:hypothetical protein
MSFAEVLEQIPRFSPEQLRKIVEVANLHKDQAASSKRPRLRLSKKDGRLIATSDEVIRQSEVDAILTDFP